MMSTSAVPVAGPSPGACSIHVLERGRRLALVGCLDVHTAADVRVALVDAVVQGSGDLVLDLSAINAVDATGLGVLVGTHRRAGRVGRSLVLQDVSPALTRILFLTRLERVLRVERSYRQV